MLQKPPEPTDLFPSLENDRMTEVYRPFEHRMSMVLANSLKKEENCKSNLSKIAVMVSDSMRFFFWKVLS